MFREMFLRLREIYREKSRANLRKDDNRVEIRYM